MVTKIVLIFLLTIFVSFSSGNNQSYVYFDNEDGINIFKLLAPQNLFNSEFQDLSDSCGLALLRYLAALGQFKPWALQMFDSTAKFPEGILYANHEFLGQYDECIAVIAPNDTFRGQHCLLEGELHATFPGIPASKRKFFFFGLCVPSVCSASDLNKSLKVVGNVTKNLVTIKARDDYCHTTDPEKPRTGDWFVVVLLLMLGVIAGFSTLYDLINKSNGNKPHPLLASFSLYSNSKTLFEISKGEGQMQCLNGIRVISTVWIVYFHTFVSLIAGPVFNLTQAFSQQSQPLYSVLASAYLAVDSFLLLSGFLLALSFFKTMSSRGTYDIPMGYIHRYFRVTPSYAMVLLFEVTLLKYIGDGPLWNFIANSQIPNCENYWWSGLLFVQNYVNPDNLCLTQTWYLSADMQLYWLSPLLLYPMWKWRKFSPALISLVILAFSVLPLCLAYSYGLSPIAAMDETGDQNRIDNYPTHSRAAPWLVGVALAYMIFDLKQKGVNMTLPKGQMMLGWIVAGVLGGLSLFGLVAFELNEQSSFSKAFYLSFHRLGWSVALAWLIFASINKMGGLINGFLSWDFFQPLAKLSYGVYLSHLTVLFYRIGIFRTNIYFNLPEVFTMAIAIWVIAHFVSILLYLLIEVPFSIIERHVFRDVKILQLPRPKPKKNVQA